MTAAIQRQSEARGLPRLRGWLLSFYLAAWSILAATAGGLAVLSLFNPSAPASILVLRLAKTVILIVVSTIFLRRRRADPVAALLSLTFLLWSTTSSFDFTGAATSLPIFLDRVRFLLFATALLLFPNADWRPGWTRHVAGASVAVFLIGAAESVGVFGTQLFLPLAIACMLAAIAALVTRFRAAETQTERQQLKWVALGLVLGVGLILTARAGAAVTAGMGMPMAVPIVLEGLFQVGIIVVALGFFVSLLRYRLFDAEAAITHSAAYAALTLTLVGTFAGSEALIEILGQQYLGQGFGNASAAIAAALAAVLLTPLHDRMRSWAERHFERDLALFKQQLPELIAELVPGASTKSLAAAVLPRIREAIHATRACLMVEGTVAAAYGVDLREARRWAGLNLHTETRGMFECEAGVGLFPVRMALRSPFGSARAWLLLGPRPDGSIYGPHELAALSAVAPALRQGLFATKSRDDERAHERRKFRDLRARLEDLASRVDAPLSPPILKRA